MMDTLLSPPWLLLAALLLDGAVGDARAVFTRVPHPVVLIGRLIAWAEARLNRPDRSDRDRLVRGGLVTVGVVGLCASLGYALDLWSDHSPVGGVLELMLVAVLVAQRGLWDHVRAVANALESKGLEGGREAVSHIVGRDPQQLDGPAVSRAAIESCAENFSDGVVAPIFWYVLLGPAGLLGYKAVNTLDSMVGHRNDRYLYFGRIAARLDDAANFLPARFAGGCLIASAALVRGPGPAAEAWRIMLRDASKHKSPNAGWQEAAMAGAVALKLAGPRRYGTELVADPYLGDGTTEAGPAHIRSALKVFVGACVVSGLVLAGLQSAL